MASWTTCMSDIREDRTGELGPLGPGWIIIIAIKVFTARHQKGDSIIIAMECIGRHLG